MARVRLIAPHDLRVHEQFILRSGDDSDQGMTFGTPACRYWRGRKSNFITHFRWTVGDEYHEISRTEVIRTWVEAYNLAGRVFMTQHIIRERLVLENPSAKVFPDPADVIKNRSQRVYMRTLQLLQLFLNDFLEAVISLESQKRAPQEWSESDLPRDRYRIRQPISALFDVSAPPTTLPFLVIQLLQKTISDTAQRQTFDDFTKRFVPPDTRMLEELTLPEGSWIAVVDSIAKKDWDPDSEIEMGLAGDHEEDLGWWSRCTKWARSLFGVDGPIRTALPMYRPESSWEEKRPLLASTRSIPEYASSSGLESKPMRKQG